MSRPGTYCDLKEVWKQEPADLRAHRSVRLRAHPHLPTTIVYQKLRKRPTPKDAEQGPRQSRAPPLRGGGANHYAVKPARIIAEVWSNLAPMQRCDEINVDRRKSGKVEWPRYLTQKEADKFDEETGAATVASMPWGRLGCESIDVRSTTPFRGTKESVGFDVFALEDVVIKPREQMEIPLGLKMAIPEGHYGQLKVRSGHARKKLMEVH